MNPGNPMHKDIDAWKARNPGFSLFDYIYVTMTEKRIPPDFLFAVQKLIWPDFVRFENGIFLKENFSEAKFRDLRAAGKSLEETEYWINLFNLDSYYPDENTDSDNQANCLALGNEIINVWKKKLESDFPNVRFDAKCIYDEEQAEVFLVFQQES